MDVILLVGGASPELVAALAARGLRLSVADPACRAALVSGAAWPRPSLPFLLLAPGEAAATRALDAGADDAVDAAAAADHIAARLAALLRRLPAPALLRLGELAIDPVERRVMRAGRPVMLLPREYAVLLHLLRHAGQVVSRAALRRAVWGMDFDPGTNVIEVHMSRLRAKLDHGFAQPMLHTAKGVGYCLDASAAAPQSAIAAARLAG